MVYIPQPIKCESEKDLHMLRTISIQLKWRGAVHCQTAENKSEKIIPLMLSQ